jgi:hypothetical protein
MASIFNFIPAVPVLLEETTGSHGECGQKMKRASARGKWSPPPTTGRNLEWKCASRRLKSSAGTAASRLNLFPSRIDQRVERLESPLDELESVMSGQGNTLATPTVMNPWMALANAWQALMAGWTAPYRPEKHYMRGPGPKWREKHGQGRSSAEW